MKEIGNRRITNRKSDVRNQTQSCSSAWLEHYTDNVGVSSSNLLGTTSGAAAVTSKEFRVMS